MVWPPPCTRGNKARGILAGSSIVKIAGSDPEKAVMETHLCVGKARGLSTELPDRELGP
jgi:hypothetical protein